MSTIQRYYYFVYLKQSWSSSWGYWPNIQPLTCNRTISPGVGSATLLYRYGSGYWENGQSMTDGSFIKSFTGYYCAIGIADNKAGYDQTTVFIGYIPKSQIKIIGQNPTGKTADQVIEAFSLEYLLETRIDTAWVAPIGVGAVTKIDSCPVFNSRSASGTIQGNRSPVKHTTFDSGTSATTYVFGLDPTTVDDTDLWTVRDIIEFVLAYYQLPAGSTGPRFTLDIPTELSTALDLMTSIYDLSSLTTRQALNLLIPRSRGLAWYIKYGTDDAVSIAVRSILDEAVTIGGVTIPAHSLADTVTADIWQGSAIVETNITIDETQRFDKVIVRGQNIKVCGSWRYTVGDLEEAWSSSEETEYKDASDGVDGYSGLTTAEKAELNDAFRSTDRFNKVFTTFRVPRTWDWKLGATNEKANPKWNQETATLDTATNAAYWNNGKRFLTMIPLLDGVDYSVTTPSDSNPDLTEAEFRRPFAIARNSDLKYVYLDKLTKTSAAVRILQTEPGVEIKFRPQYLFSGTSWSDEPGLWTDDLATYGIDCLKLILTAMIETDQPFQVYEIIRQTESMRTKVIDLPGAELWYVPPFTVVDVADDGTLKTYGPTSGQIRNDVDQLKAIRSAAAAWYGRTQSKISLKLQNILPYVKAGQMLRYDDVLTSDDSTVRSIISSIGYQFTGPKPSMTMMSEYAELDIVGIYGSSNRSTSPTIPSMAVAAKTIDKIKSDVEAVKKEVNKNPLRAETQTPPGSVATVLRKAYAKAAAGAVSTITCYLDTDGTGEEISVNCSIANGSALNAAIPRLLDGTEITVWNDNGTWRSAGTFQGTENCLCSS